MTATETWVPLHLPGFEGLYQVSDQGRVRTTYERAYNYPQHYLMKATPNAKGFHRVTLAMHEGGHKSFGVHRLVAWAFLELPPNYERLIVEHIDGDRSNNRVGNLRWVKKHFPTFSGQKHWNARLSDSEVAEMRRLAAQGVMQKELCERYGMTSGAVSNIVNQKAWKVGATA